MKVSKKTATVVYSGSGPMPDLSDDVLEFERAPSGLSELSAARSGRNAPHGHGAPDATPEPSSTAKPPKPAHASQSAKEKACYDRLKQWRLERSKANGVPAYVVFDNKVLAELSRRRPVTDRELLKVRSIGPHKLNAYGADLKELLAACR